MKPGTSVQKDETYKAFPTAKRRHWETGDNNDLTEAQKKKLAKKAEEAGKYNRKSKTSGKDYPRKKDGTIDHGALVRNAKQYVEDGLEPDKDVQGNPAPYRGLDDIVDICSTPQKPIDPSKDESDPDWVCTQHARYLAGLLRSLDYPVREVTVGLSQGGKYTYQESAIQVWFEGKWHFVDPYLCLYDPSAILGPYSQFTDYKAWYWDGTSTPESHPADPEPDSGWKPLKDPGADLQKRFYPSKTDEKGRDRSSKEKFSSFPPGFELERVANKESPGENQRSGVFLTTRAEGVTFALMNTDGQVVDGERNEIPGAFRIPAGSPISFMHEEPAPPEPGVKLDTVPLSLDYHDESLFFGTRDIQATYHEIGTHELTLLVSSERPLIANLEWKILQGEHQVTVAGLPDCVELMADNTSAIQFSVTIDPVEGGFHTLFGVLMQNHVLNDSHYRPAADRVRAIQLRNKGVELQIL